MQAKRAQPGRKSYVPLRPRGGDAVWLLFGQHFVRCTVCHGHRARTSFLEELLHASLDTVHEWIGTVAGHAVSLRRHPSITARLTCPANLVGVWEDNGHNSKTRRKVLAVGEATPNPRLGGGQMLWPNNLLELLEDVVIAPGNTDQRPGEEPSATVCRREAVQLARAEQVLYERL